MQIRDLTLRFQVLAIQCIIFLSNLFKKNSRILIEDPADRSFNPFVLTLNTSVFHILYVHHQTVNTK